MRPRILFVVERFHTNLWEATRALNAAQIDVAVWGSGSGKTEDHSVVAPRVFPYDADPAAFRSAWDDLKPDLVILRNVAAHRRAVARLARASGTPMWFYDLNPYHWREPLKRRLTRRFQGLPQRRVTPVLGLDTTIRPSRDARYIPWPVMAAPEPTPGEAQARSGREVTVLCVAKLHNPRKNHGMVIDALRAQGRAGKVRLLLAGTTGDPVQNAAQISALEDLAAAEPWLELHANVPFKQMPELYRQADICILPSVREPLGFAPVESMAYGCVPVISTDAGSAGYVRHGENGLRVDVSRPGAVEEVLSSLIDDAALRQRLGAAALETAQGELGAERFVTRMRALLQESGVSA
ncbi:glycosyltransferase family 4 protein [Salipiger pacificus]|nr:glycosyltransferase family 4 protein [Alloyangia pacifica]MCA0946527.1 glycosyltransferase family 4 protein [Alloyangia pacifica]